MDIQSTGTRSEQAHEDDNQRLVGIQMRQWGPGVEHKTFHWVGPEELFLQFQAQPASNVCRGYDLSAIARTGRFAPYLDYLDAAPCVLAVLWMRFNVATGSIPDDLGLSSDCASTESIPANSKGPGLGSNNAYSNRSLRRRVVTPRNSAPLVNKETKLTPLDDEIRA